MKQVLFITWFCIGVTGVTFAAPVAIVADVVGNARAKHKGKSLPLQLTAEIETDTRIELAAKANIVLLYLRTGDTYSATGPTTLLVKPDTVKSSDTSKLLHVNAKPAFAGLRVVRPERYERGAIVMRTSLPSSPLRLLTLNGVNTLQTEPEFRWTTVDSIVEYHFQLFDQTGKLLHEDTVKATSYRLPPAVSLIGGHTYTWSVATKSTGGPNYVNSGDFGLLTPEIREAITADRPSIQSPVAERVAFAIRLVSVGLRDEAHAIWRALAVERPNEVRLKALVPAK